MSEGAESGGHAFVCHVREDAEHADELCGLLAGAGIPVWRDTANMWPGESWRAKIRAAITRDALVFLACFSRRSVAQVRSYQNEELSLAVGELRRHPPGYPWLIPVRFDDCELPDWEIGPGRWLADLYLADLFGDKNGENADRLVTAVRRMLGAGQEPPSAAAADAADAAPQAAAPQASKYVINISDSQNVQIGDGNTQHNIFGRPAEPEPGR